MEPEKSNNPLNPLLSFIQTNPMAVVVVLVVLIVVTVISIVAMLQIQTEQTPVAMVPTQVVVQPTNPPTFTPTPRPSLTPEPTATPTKTPTPTKIPSPTPTFTPTPIVVDWRELGELDTLEVSTVTVFEDTNPRWWIVPDAKILVRVTGQANFGIDITLAEIEQLADTDGTTIRLILPHATVTGVELIDAQVYDEQWFPNAALGIGATQKALDDIENWANEQENLLEVAEKLGQAQLESFLRLFGFEDIEIVFQ